MSNRKPGETKRETCVKNMKKQIMVMYPRDPLSVQLQSNQFETFHRIRIFRPVMRSQRGLLRYPKVKGLIVGWGEINYKPHWWIQMRHIGMIKSACGIFGERSNVQWSEHFPGLARCEVCQDYEIKHLGAKAKVIKLPEVPDDT